MVRDELSFTLRNALPELDRLREHLEVYCSDRRLPPRMLFDLNLALDELVTNIISYGYPQGGEHDIRITLALSDSSLTVRLEDDGIAFDPLRAAAPDLESPLEQRRVGGLGIHLVRKIMDGIEYHREGGLNVLTMYKNLCASR